MLSLSLFEEEFPLKKPKVPRGQKRCPKCSTIKSTSNFNKSKSTPDRLCGICKQCRSKYVSEKYLANKAAAQEKSMIRRYGVNWEQYHAMLKAQGGVCAICKAPPPTGITGRGRHSLLSIDHDHETGVVRGLLCGKCNQGIGHLGESRETLISAIGYLASPPGIPK